MSPANHYLQEHDDFILSQWIIKVEAKHHNAACLKINSLYGCSVVTGTISAQILLLMISCWQPCDLTTWRPRDPPYCPWDFESCSSIVFLSQGKTRTFDCLMGVSRRCYAKTCRRAIPIYWTCGRLTTRFDDHKLRIKYINRGIHSIYQVLHV